ncbi:DUF2946 family protein [Advenella sp. RU8]|uniref:DUF2946 family protein n=1 Tax=Advenella sp. RU8 TaxID=3399575 RepID=UPI003AAFF41C
MNVNRIFSHKGVSYRYIFIYLCLALFALRSLIPVGYMPNMQALGQGKIEIIICTPAGSQSTFVSIETSPHQQIPDNAHDGMLSCPFSVINAQGMLAGSPDLGVEAFNLPELVVPSLSHSQVNNVRHSGPPLGSRAPPVAI